MNNTATQKISNRKIAQACNASRGVATFEIPWPTDVLGQYGENASTDADLDAYVAAQIEPDVNVIVLGGCAGRTRQGVPVIVVSIRRACDAYGSLSRGGKMTIDNEHIACSAALMRALDLESAAEQANNPRIAARLSARAWMLRAAIDRLATRQIAIFPARIICRQGA